MKSRSIEHQFEFWTNLGKVGGYIHQYNGYTTLLPCQGTWPSKTFNIQNNSIIKLKTEILKNNIPNTVALDADDVINQILIENHFNMTSVVEGMSVNVSSKMVFEDSPNIIKIEDETGIDIFSSIASNAFGYNIHPTVLVHLLQDTNTQLFIGQYKSQFVSCGILYLDKKGDSGLHMIGAKKQTRGLGLGKEMTQHLLANALKNHSNEIHLVASKFGAPIYRKYGFTNRGYLNSYSL
ncbi:GNAT family N-acetyltransferase [uncultured Winogradskyella sp.]|uniref:GNAT family N-acetyltransferase n=1 Tax=uncultured Winogradskyella sp. TaxID=395353 RepID=UPI00260752C7|nr:GNAT family N-acetyltransferase [uncultured Winogradskyella sp.]